MSPVSTPAEIVALFPSGNVIDPPAGPIVFVLLATGPATRTDTEDVFVVSSVLIAERVIVYGLGARGGA